MRTWMSQFNSVVAVFAMFGLVCGCTAPNPFWRRQPSPMAQAPSLPIVPNAAEYKSYANTSSLPPFAQSSAPSSGCGGRGRCGCGSGSGGCSSGGSCNTNVAVGPLAAPQNQYGGGVRPEAQMAQQNPSQPAAGVGGQKTCPVSGEALGSMGPPVPVTVKGQTIYVCCQGCVESVQRDPDTYLAKVIQERTGK